MVEPEENNNHAQACAEQNHTPMSSTAITNPLIGPQEISPLPSTSGLQQRSKKRKAEGTTVLTNTLIIESIEKQDVESRRAAKRAKKNLSALQPAETESDAFSVDITARSMFILRLYSESGSKESWIRYQRWSCWAHCDCTRVKKSRKQYICER